METFGDRLRSERESRGLSIEAVGEKLRVDQEWLRSLERNDFAALPEEAVMMPCLRAYAGCLEVDAELMIEDYEQERAKTLRRLAAAVTNPTLEIPPAATRPDPLRRPPVPRWLVASSILAAVVALGVWWMLPGDAIESTTTAPEPVAAPAPPVEAQPMPARSRAEVAPARPEPPAREAPSAAPAPPVLHVAEHGVGTGVEKRRLVGRGDRFREGSRVWFWTRVENGSRGDRIDHVWLHEGVEAARIPLEVGGASWRTYSSKTLHPGSAGSWAVEARDEDGRVLARREFTCLP